MSAFLDSLVGGYDGSDSGGVGASSGLAVIASQESSGTNYAAGFMQSLASLGTGYLAKRMDVDLYGRIAGAQPQVQLRTTQNGIGGYGQIAAGTNGQQYATFNLSALMPIALVAIAAYFLAKRGG